MGAKYRDCRLLFTPLSLILVLSSSKYGYAIENITRSQQLFQEKTLISPGQVFELGFFSPDNSGTYQYVGIWYKGMSPQTVVWVANRENPLRVADPSTSLNIGDNGNLELVDGNQTSVWSTNVRVPSNSSVATLLDNGNLVLKDGELGEILWQSFDHPGDTFLPSSVIGYNAKTGQSFVLTSWKSKGDPSRGSFTVGISPKMKPAQAINWNGTTPQWRTGPWSKLKFIGVPEMDDSYESQFGLAEDWERGTTYLYFNSIVSMYSHTLLSSDGTLKYMVKENGSDWRMVWRFPKNLCDVYGVCGPSGVCKASETPVCSCLTGFVPKSDLEWSKQNWTQGCLRRTKLSCEQNSSSPNSKGQKKDVFVQFHNMKLPDFYEYVSSRENINSCQTWCLDNCSCRAYAYVNGIGCLIWSEYLVDIQEFSYGGEDLFLRLSHRELGGQKNKMIIISLTIVSCVVTFTVLLLITLHRWRGNQKRNVEETKEKSHSIKAGKNLGSAFQFAEQHDVPEFPIFDFHSISVATDYFSIENKLGQGGFGPVYKGKLQDGTEIAVKRLSSSSGQGMQEFKNEMILISKLQHRNLVRLVGCCIDREERLLIYELMPNRSLDNFIVDPKRRVQLNWTMRFNIINGIARGLLYLHRDSCFKVIHRDLKISNILLDENMNPKISDFGLARIFQGTLDLANTNRVVGTFGYMSPEYAMGGIFSEKSDVFSFGVLILEIVGGRKNTSFQYYENHLSLIAYAWHLWSEGRGIDMVDNALEGSYSSVEAMRCIHVGLLCVQDHAVDRPTMPDIVSMLRNEMGLSHPKEPLFTFQRSLELQQQSDSRCSANEVTMSSIQGR